MEWILLPYLLSLTYQFDILSCFVPVFNSTRIAKLGYGWASIYKSVHGLAQTRWSSPSLWDHCARHCCHVSTLPCLGCILWHATNACSRGSVKDSVVPGGINKPNSLKPSLRPPPATHLKLFQAVLPFFFALPFGALSADYTEWTVRTGEPSTRPSLAHQSACHSNLPTAPVEEETRHAGAMPASDNMAGSSVGEYVKNWFLYTPYLSVRMKATTYPRTRHGKPYMHFCLW